MKFSVVIPTYNNKILLKNTLEALNSQKGYDYNDYEVVVVDDGSTDDTENYIRGVNRTYPLKHIYLSRNELSCRAKTRNAGWRNTSGDIIAFIDSDIIVQEDYLFQLNQCFSMSEDILVLGNRIMIDKPIAYKDVKNGNIYKMYHFDKDRYNVLEFRHFIYWAVSYNSNSSMCPWIQTYSCNMAVKKKWMKKIGGFDENFIKWGMEDIEVGYSLYKNGIQVIFNPKLEVLHQYHGPRNDLIIEKPKISGYEDNIDYFICKHHEALKMNKKIAYKFLKGETSVDIVLMEEKGEKYEIELKDKNELQKVKEKILEVSINKTFKVCVYDYDESTDLYMWIQLLGKDSKHVRYYPMSKQVDIYKLMEFIINEKNCQQARN